MDDEEFDIIIKKANEETEKSLKSLLSVAEIQFLKDGEKPGDRTKSLAKSFADMIMEGKSKENDFKKTESGKTKFIKDFPIEQCKVLDISPNVNLHKTGKKQ